MYIDKSCKTYALLFWLWDIDIWVTFPWTYEPIVFVQKEYQGSSRDYIIVTNAWVSNKWHLDDHVSITVTQISLKSDSIVHLIFINVIFIFSSQELKVQLGLLYFRCFSFGLSLHITHNFFSETTGSI